LGSIICDGDSCRSQLGFAFPFSRSFASFSCHLSWTSQEAEQAQKLQELAKEARWEGVPPWKRRVLEMKERVGRFGKRLGPVSRMGCDDVASILTYPHPASLPRLRVQHQLLAWRKLRRPPSSLQTTWRRPCLGLRALFQRAPGSRSAVLCPRHQWWHSLWRQRPHPSRP